MAAGFLVSTLGLPIIGIMILFNDTGVPMASLAPQIFALLIAIALFAGVNGLCLLTVRRYTSLRLLLSVAASAALTGYLIAVPPARAAFDFAVEFFQQIVW